MHELLVQPLPRGCRLTAIFDVRQIHIDLSISTLKKHPQCCRSGTILGSSFSDTSTRDTLTYHIQDLRYWVWNLFFQTALLRL
jgi:hypothetical protein